MHWSYKEQFDNLLRNMDADFLIVGGTSLEVYPAASLIDYVPYEIPKFLVDPMPTGLADESFHVVEAQASEGVSRVAAQLRAMMA